MEEPLLLIGIEHLTYLNKNYQDMQMKFHIAIVNHSGFLLITQQLGLKVCPLSTYTHYNTEFSVKIFFHLEKQYVLMVGNLKNITHNPTPREI